MAFIVKPVSGIGDVRELEKRPWEETITADCVYDLLRSSAAKRPDKSAITFLPTGAAEEDPVRITYGQLFGRITQAANMFHDLGAGPADCVSFLLPSLPQAHFTFWGAQAAGIANPINFLLNPDQIADLLNAAGTRVLVALGPHPVLDIWKKVEAIRDKVPTLKAILRVGKPGDEPEGVYNFDKTIAGYPADRLTFDRTFSRSDIATYFPTGGTTGSPKLAPHTQGNTLYAVWAVAHLWGFTDSAILVNGLPLFHVAGSIICSLSPFCVGTEVIIPTPAGFRNPTFVQNHWKLIEKYRVTHMGGMPTSLVALLNVPLNGADMSSVKICLTGGAPLPTEVQRAFESTFNIQVSQMYGMTEAGSIVAMTPAFGKAKIGSVGIRLPHEQIRVARLNQDGSPGEFCGLNETGVVMLKGPNIFPGYKDSVQNRGTLTDDGWLITGDLGYIDEEERVYLTGRSKDLIIRSGHNIDPSIIEEAAGQHPSVALSAAVGKPDSYAGELPVLFVQLKPEAHADPEELMKFLEDRISERPAMPKEIIFTKQLPLTAIGKIFKPQLRWDLARREFAGMLAPLEAKGVKAVVEVGEDKRWGTLVRIVLSGDGGAAREEIEGEIKRMIEAFPYVKIEVMWK